MTRYKKVRITASVEPYIDGGIRDVWRGQMVRHLERLAHSIPEGEAVDVLVRLAVAENIKPSNIMAALREFEISRHGMPETCWGNHRRVVRWYTLVGERCVLIHGAPLYPMRKVYNQMGRVYDEKA